MRTIHVGPAEVCDTLRREAMEQVATAADGLCLDFAAVARIDTQGAGALEELAAAAEARSVRIVLQAVNSEIYKVLKRTSLAERFEFAS